MRLLFLAATNGGFGLLYNRAALDDTRNIAPEGWRPALLDDYVDLINYLGGQTVAGGDMKALKKWTAPNTGATNASGLTVLPAGHRDNAGTFAGLLTNSILWIK